jgi:hypothetical protein
MEHPACVAYFLEYLCILNRELQLSHLGPKAALHMNIKELPDIIRYICLLVVVTLVNFQLFALIWEVTVAGLMIL